MISIRKVDKYFNRFQKNQIHVINKTSLEFEETGLVAFLGPSGCGKTTLLNVIGGLDKVNGGSVYINNKKLTRFSDNAIDNIRNREIGYVFQDYYLVDDLTVFDNVALALKMIGVKDKTELTSRVNYVLNAVGLYRYRNRYTDMLSGGERQRVAIARAIVKDPKIIIADEPTGNLDSRNTLEIMKIIKAISKHRLVILVTHEKNLANFYASRIIEIRDGVVQSDQINQQEEDLDYRIDQKIYLRDLPGQLQGRIGNLFVKYYSDESTNSELTIVIKNNSIYIQGPPQQRIENVNNFSMIELVDDNYRKISKNEDIDEFNMAKGKKKDFKVRYRSVFTPWSMMVNGVKKILNYSLLRKILLLAFLITALFTTYSISSITATLTYDDGDFLKVNREYLTYKAELTVDEYLELEENPLIETIVLGDSSFYFNFPLNNYYQSQNFNISMNCSLTPLEQLDEALLIYGRKPENINEIVIDKRAIVEMERNYQGMAKQAGLLKIEDYLGRNLTHQLLGNIAIVGITDQKSPSVYLDKSVFLSLIAAGGSSDGGYFMGDMKYGYEEDQKIFDYNFAKGLTLKKGRWPENDYEVLVNYDNRFEMKLNKTIGTRVNNKKLKVVGYFTSKNEDYNFYVNANTLKYQMVLKHNEFSLLCYDKAEALEIFRAESKNVVDTYETSKTAYLESIRLSIESSLMFAGVLLLICIVEIYLVIRASFLARIREVGVYRAIGMKKKDIYKMFLGEILVITLIASFTGVGVMYYILDGMQQVPYIERMFVIDWRIGLGSAGLLFLINIIFGLLPVFSVIRKKPAAILARSDV